MMRIDSLNNTPDRAGRYTVRFSDGSVMRVYRQTMEDFGLYTGMELSDEQLIALRKASGEMSAKMRAVRIVAAGSVSKRDLERRLIQKGETSTDAKTAVSWLADLDIVDDRKTAEQVVQRCISKGYGLARAKKALYEKQIPAKYWDAVLEDYPDQLDVITAFLAQRVNDTSDRAEVKKAIDALLRKGHSYGTICQGMRQLMLDTEEFPED